MSKSLLPWFVGVFWRMQVTNPKPPLEQIPLGLDKNGTQQPTQQLACGICGAPVPLDNCKIDEHGAAVHERCYFEKVSARNYPKI